MNRALMKILKRRKKEAQAVGDYYKVDKIQHAIKLLRKKV